MSQKLEAEALKAQPVQPWPLQNYKTYSISC